MTRIASILLALLILGCMTAGFLETEQEKATNPDIDQTRKLYGDGQ